MRTGLLCSEVKPNIPNNNNNNNNKQQQHYL